MWPVDWIFGNIVSRELLPVVMALTQWGDKWVRPGPIACQSRSGLPVETQPDALMDQRERRAVEVAAGFR